MTIPDAAKTHKDYLQWIKDIQLEETPAWSGLPNNVEKIVLQRKAKQLVMNIKMIQGTGDELAGGEENDDKANWLGALKVRLEKYLELLPGQLTLLTRTA